VRKKDNKKNQLDLPEMRPPDLQRENPRGLVKRAAKETKMTITIEGIVSIILGAIGIIGMFVRLEHRLTKIETIVKLIMGSMGLCRQPSDKDSQ